MNYNSIVYYSLRVFATSVTHEAPYYLVLHFTKPNYYHQMPHDYFIVIRLLLPPVACVVLVSFCSVDFVPLRSSYIFFTHVVKYKYC